MTQTHAQCKCCNICNNINMSNCETLLHVKQAWEVWQISRKGKWRATYAALNRATCAFAGESEEWPGHTSCPSYRDYMYESAPQPMARRCKQICRVMCFKDLCVYLWGVDLGGRCLKENLLTQPERQTLVDWAKTQVRSRVDLTKRHDEAAWVREKEALLIYYR